MLSSINWLLWIWSISCVLAAMAVFLLCLLVLFRVFQTRIQKQYDRRYQELEKIFLIHMTCPLRNLKETFVQKKYDIEILSLLVQKLLYILKGSEQQRVCAFIVETGLMKEVYSQARSHSLKKKIAAIQLLAYFVDDQTCLNFLINRIQLERNRYVICTIAESLARSQDLECFPYILTALGRYPQLSSLFIYNIFNTLGNHQLALPKLKAIINDPAINKNIKAGAILSLGNLHTHESQTLLSFLAQHGDEILKSTVYQALSNNRQAISLEVAKVGCASQDWKIRMYTADCMKYNPKFFVEPLMHLAKDKNWMVSIRAIESIVSFKEAGLCVLKMLTQEKSILGARAQEFLDKKEHDYVI